jgi:hypothetical protein
MMQISEILLAFFISCYPGDNGKSPGGDLSRQGKIGIDPDNGSLCDARRLAAEC